MTGLLCRALGPHALKPDGPLVVIPGGLQVRFVCMRCHTIRRERWDTRGRYAGGRRYFHDKTYKGILEEYDRLGARAAWVSGAEKVHAPAAKGQGDESNAQGLRLVQGGKKRRGGAVRAHKRAGTQARRRA